MSAFEYVFTFYGLLPGLAAANVATGFADMWRNRRQVDVGVCTPLIALIVLLGAMSLWLRFWASREMALRRCFDKRARGPEPLSKASAPVLSVL